MFWSTVNFPALAKQSIAIKQRQTKTLSFIGIILKPLIDIYDSTLYKMQHNGATIYLEKVLNEYFKVAGYDPMNHEETKKIYIEDIEVPKKLYVFQDEESEEIYLDAEGEDLEEVYLDAEVENLVAFSFIIFMPMSLEFEEYQVRNLVDYYRYFGKKYNIQTYTP